MACRAFNPTALSTQLRSWAEERHLAVAIPSLPDCRSDCTSDFPQFPHDYPTSPSTFPSLQHPTCDEPSPTIPYQRRLLLGSRCGTPRVLFRQTPPISAADRPATTGRSRTAPSAFCAARGGQDFSPCCSTTRETTAAAISCTAKPSWSAVKPFSTSSKEAGMSHLMKLARCDLLGSRCGTPRRAPGPDPRAFHRRPRSVTWDLPRDEVPFSYSMPVPPRGLRLLRADVLGSTCGTPKFFEHDESDATWSC